MSSSDSLRQPSAMEKAGMYIKSSFDGLFNKTPEVCISPLNMYSSAEIKYAVGNHYKIACFSSWMYNGEVSIRIYFHFERLPFRLPFRSFLRLRFQTWRCPLPTVQRLSPSDGVLPHHAKAQARSETAGKRCQRGRVGGGHRGSAPYPGRYVTTVEPQ